MTNKIRPLLGRAKQILHEEGRLALFKAILRSLKGWLFVYYSYDAYETSLDDVPIIPCKVDDLTLRVVTRPEEVDQLSYEGFYPSRRSIDKQIVTHGGRLYCAFVGKELAHITEVVTGKSHKLHYFGFAWQYGNTVWLAHFTPEKYRRKGIFNYVHSTVLQHLREKGSRVWVAPDRANIPYLTSIAKLGYYFWGEAYHIGLLSLFTIEWIKPKSRLASRRIHCSLNRKKG